MDSTTSKPVDGPGGVDGNLESEAVATSSGESGATGTAGEVGTCGEGGKAYDGTGEGGTCGEAGNGDDGAGDGGEGGGELKSVRIRLGATDGSLPTESVSSRRLRFCAPALRITSCGDPHSEPANDAPSTRRCCGGGGSDRGAGGGEDGGR
jgi:hypothetical protein